RADVGGVPGSAALPVLRPGRGRAGLLPASRRRAPVRRAGRTDRPAAERVRDGADRVSHHADDLLHSRPVRGGEQADAGGARDLGAVLHRPPRRRPRRGRAPVLGRPGRPRPRARRAPVEGEAADPKVRPAGGRAGMRRLRRQAAKDVARLREALVTTEAEQGRRYAVCAYDAAQILYDDAKDDEERAIDLVGAIVLARQGLLALLRDTDSPPVPCLVNPLHGESAARRRLTLIHDDALPHRAPLCASCADRQERFGVTEASLLRIPGPGGRRPHLAVPGVWRDTAWGARGRKNFLPR